MAEDFAMQERILKMLENIITNDHDLRSFSIVFEQENKKNKSPILYEDHHLALESWCVKHIYRYAYTELLDTRPLLKKLKLSATKAKSLNHLLIGTLLINPDVSTFWAMKRELVECDVLDIQEELLFTKLVLSYKGKSNETFAYRRWLLKRFLSRTTDIEVFGFLYRSELSVAEVAAEKSPNNYHAWTHRIWCAQNIANQIPDSVLFSFYNQELVFSLRWIEQHVSENTGYHYRQYLFKLFKTDSYVFHFQHYLSDVLKHLNLITDSESLNFLDYLLGGSKNRSLTIQKKRGCLNYVTLLLNELFFTIEKLNCVFFDHETIWYHRRFIVYHLVQIFYEYHGIKNNSIINKHDNFCSANDLNNPGSVAISYLRNNEVSESGEKQPKMFKIQPIEIESSRLYEILCKSEEKFISQNSDRHPLDAEYSKRHMKWLKFVLGFNKL